MDYKVIWSNPAITDLKEICDYIAKRDPTAALKVGQGILEHVCLLESFPLIGPPYPRGSRGDLREIVFRKWRIFYEADEAARRVEILHIRHSARDEPD